MLSLTVRVCKPCLSHCCSTVGHCEKLPEHSTLWFRNSYVYSNFIISWDINSIHHCVKGQVEY